MPDINFQPLFEYFDQKFTEHGERFDRIEEKFNTLEMSMDGVVKIAQDVRDEIMVSHHRFDRLEDAVFGKIGK